jgi:hypothetical protein
LGGSLIKDHDANDLGVYLVLNRVKECAKGNGKGKNHIPLAIFIVLIYLFFSAYFSYSSWVEIDFPSSKSRFENPDQDYLLADQQDKSEILKPSALTAIVETASPGKLLLSSFRKSLHDPKGLVLRC